LIFKGIKSISQFKRPGGGIDSSLSIPGILPRILSNKSSASEKDVKTAYSTDEHTANLDRPHQKPLEHNYLMDNMLPIFPKIKHTNYM
jgi:hypothetical protein